MEIRRETSGLSNESNPHRTSAARNSINNNSFWTKSGWLTMIRLLLLPCLAICAILSSDFIQMVIAEHAAKSNNTLSERILLNKTVVVLDKIPPEPPLLIANRAVLQFANKHKGKAAELDNDRDDEGQLVESIDLNRRHHHHLVDSLQTAAQSEESINPSKNSQRVDISLYQAIKNQNINDTGLSSQAEQVNELNRDFLTLFDELWRIKNSSVNALVRLEYFNKTRLQQQHDQYLERNRTNQQQLLDSGGNTNQDRRFGSTSDGSTPRLNRINLKNNLKLLYEKQGQQLKSNQLVVANKLGLAANRVSSWLSSAQQRIQAAVDSLCAKLFDKFALIKPVSSRLGQANAQSGPSSNTNYNYNDQLHSPTSILDINDRIKDIISSSDDPNVSTTPANDTRLRVKRSSSSGPTQLEAADQYGQGSKACNNLTIDEVTKCRSTEALINSTLNNSFPGTLGAIEENCHHITFLLSNCWPEQLQQLRNSLSSWNESLLLHADFALPSGFIEQKLASSYEGGSCGVAPESMPFIRDRINWMWLNLCIDKKFRHDYINNLRCLSTWNQEKAQTTCSHEYKRMQSYLASQAEAGNALGVGFEWATNSKRTRASATESTLGGNSRNLMRNPDEMSGNGNGIGDSVAASAADALDSKIPASIVSQSSNGSKILLTESELSDREVSSKMLCCMFDQFLRCVHKQAVHDCGRPGAQHVVNFMSRIGTDDMKFLCNSETKTVNRSKATNSGGGGGSRRTGGSHDRSPFIEANYCTDPRIQTGLFNEQSDRDRLASGGANENSSGSYSGGIGGGNNNGGPNRNTGRVRAKNPNHHINFDPTFFGSDKMTFSAAQSELCPPTMTLTSGLSLLSMIVIIFMS